MGLEAGVDSGEGVLTCLCSSISMSSQPDTYQEHEAVLATSCYIIAFIMTQLEGRELSLISISTWHASCALA